MRLTGPSWAWLGGPRSILLQAVALTAAGVLWLSPRFSSWIGSWKQALDLAAGSTGFIGPFAAGAACLAYARLRRSAVTELMAQGRHDLRVWVRPAVAVWSLACAALLTVALGATTLASLGGVPSYWGSVWILLPALVVVGAQTAIGAAIGFRSGRTWTAPMAVAGVYSVSLLMSSGVVPEVSTPGASPAPSAGSVSSPARSGHRRWPAWASPSSCWPPLTHRWPGRPGPVGSSSSPGVPLSSPGG